MADDSDDRVLADLVPIIQPNVILTFSSELAGSGDFHDDKNHKYLQMDIKDKGHFKIKPKDMQEIACVHYLKTDIPFNKFI